MKAFMSWPLILCALLVVLNILVYITDVKAGIVVSVGILIYIGIAVVVLRCHKPFVVYDLIAFANQYDTLEKRILEELGQRISRVHGSHRSRAAYFCPLRC